MFNGSPDLVHLTTKAPANYDDRLEILNVADAKPLVVF
jgi:hypothetical protein